eukprot:jgi/Mesen1/2344/ME000156S01490
MQTMRSSRFGRALKTSLTLSHGVTGSVTTSSTLFVQKRGM